MSCKCNGAPMCEGRHEYAMMPAVVRCDSRKPTDPRPLTREQILAMPGVSLLPVRKPAVRPHRAKYVPVETRKAYGRISDADLAGMVKQYNDNVSFDSMATHFGRDRCTIREALKRVGVYKKVYCSRIRGEHLAKKQEGAAA